MQKVSLQFCCSELQVVSRSATSSVYCSLTPNLSKTSHRWWKEGTRNNRFSVRLETSWCSLLLPLPVMLKNGNGGIHGRATGLPLLWLKYFKLARFLQKYCMQPPLCRKIKTHLISPPSCSSTSPWRHRASTFQIEAVQGQLVGGFCGTESPVLIPSQPSQSPRDLLSGYI